MILDNLYLELTRNCTIECEHCLRGNKESKNMNSVTLENIFKDIKEIHGLLLSGGEPLINIKAIEQISQLIKKYNIKVDSIGIITNGTIMSERHIKTLQELKDSCGSFDFILSNDVFHKSEWKRLNVEQRVRENYRKYNELFEMRKFPLNESFYNVILVPKGKAMTLTVRRIEEITKNLYINYKFRDIEKDYDLSYDEAHIHGKICIDVNGNIVDYSMSYSEEDEFSDNGFNVNLYPFSEIVKAYIDQYIKRIYTYKKKKN